MNPKLKWEGLLSWVIHTSRTSQAFEVTTVDVGNLDARTRSQSLGNPKLHCMGRHKEYGKTLGKYGRAPVLR